MSTSSTFPNVETLFAWLETLQEHPLEDEALRERLYEATRRLSWALETPSMTIQRIMYSPLQLIMARTANEMEPFDMLTNGNSEGISTARLAEVKDVDPVLLKRLLAYLASMGMIKEAGEDSWAGTNITSALAIPGYQAGIRHHVDETLSYWQAIPSFLKDTSYKNPSDSLHTCFQRGLGTNLHSFAWAAAHPEAFKNFNLWMTASRMGKQSWLDEFNFEQEVAPNSDSEEIIFVDVGGGIGTQCFNLRQHFPHLAGRVILQDLETPIKQALKVDGMETMIHDFLTEQPVKGARSYFLRKVMHDNPDKKCIAILQNIIKSMGPFSVILIDDMILPTQGVHWRATQIDITVMAGLAAMERTAKQWADMLDKAELKVVKTVVYHPDLHDTIIVTVPK